MDSRKYKLELPKKNNKKFVPVFGGNKKFVLVGKTETKKAA